MDRGLSAVVRPPHMGGPKELWRQRTLTHNTNTTLLLRQEEVLRLEYYESKATKGTHRATPKSTADNHDDFTMDQIAFMDARALRRRQKYSSKYRIFPRDLRTKAKDIPSTATAKSESEETRTAHQDRSRSRHTFR
jgi:hypothetical protein